MTPILIFVLGFSPVTAVGTDIFHGAVFKSVGALRHRRLGTVQGRLSGWMFVGSAPMSLVGVWAASQLGEVQAGAKSAESWALGGAFLLGGAGPPRQERPAGADQVRDPFVLSRRDKVAAVIIGLFGGFIVGLTSVGTGVFFGLTLLIVFPLRAGKVVGTDLFHAACLLWVAGIGHLVAGHVDLHAVAWMLMGSIPGVLIGSEWSVRLPDKVLRIVLAGVLGFSGLRLIVPGSSAWATVASLVGTVAGCWLASVAGRRWQSGGVRLPGSERQQNSLGAQQRAARRLSEGQPPAVKGVGSRPVADSTACATSSSRTSRNVTGIASSAIAAQTQNAHWKPPVRAAGVV